MQQNGCKTRIKNDSQPVFKKNRNMPFTLLTYIDKELQRLEQMDVILKIQYKWASPAINIKKKSNEIRVCSDFFTGLNAALKEHHYPLLSLDEVFSKLNGGKIFSKIDLSDAYLQVPMEENSSRLLCKKHTPGPF